MNFSQTPEFAKELKKLSKKWRSLPADLAVLQKVITTLYMGANGVPASHIRETFFATKKGAILRTVSENSEVVKIRLDCSDLNKDMLRVTFIQSEEAVLLVELYAKNQKAREDTERIQKHLKSKLL